MMKLVNDKLDSHNGSIWKEHAGTGHVLFDPNTVEDKRDSDSGATGEEDSVMAESTFLISIVETWQTCLKDRQTLLLDVLSYGSEEEKMETSFMPMDFVEFLCHNTHGPKLDTATVSLISHFFVVHDWKSFIQYSQQSFPAMLHPLTEHKLRYLTLGGLQHVKLYGKYLMDHNLVNQEGSIETNGLLDPKEYVMYCWTHQWRTKRKFKQALAYALEERIHGTHTHAAQLSSLLSCNHKWTRDFVLHELAECLHLKRAYTAQQLPTTLFSHATGLVPTMHPLLVLAMHLHIPLYPHWSETYPFQGGIKGWRWKRKMMKMQTFGRPLKRILPHSQSLIGD
jgi:hypothetical protein